MSLPPSSSLVTALAGARHHRRPGDEHVRDALDHQRVVAGHEPRRAEPRDRAERQRHDRHACPGWRPPSPSRDWPARRCSPWLSIVFTEPPPPVPSTRRTIGRRSSFAICSDITCFCQIAASAAPPRTVKSSPPTTTGRPSMRPRPNTKLAGWSDSSSPFSSYRARPASAPISWKLSRVEQGVDPLAHGELAGIVLALDLVGPAHLPRQRLAPAQFLDLGFPAHYASRTRPSDRATIASRREATRAGDMAEIKVRSELNAIVWKIEVAAGAAVTEGDTLIILEAMKMEIPVAAPRAGTVKTDRWSTKASRSPRARRWQCWSRETDACSSD